MSKRSRSVAGLTVDSGTPEAPPLSCTTEDERTVLYLSAQIEECCQACLRVCAELDKNAQADFYIQQAKLPSNKTRKCTDVQLSLKTVVWTGVLQNWYPGRTRDYERVEDVFHTGLDFTQKGYVHWKNMITAMRKCSQEYAAFGESLKVRRNLEALLHNAVALEKHLSLQLSDITSRSAKADLWRSDVHQSTAKAEFQEFMTAWTDNYRIEKVVSVVEKPIMITITGVTREPGVFRVKPSTHFRRVAEAFAEAWRLPLDKLTITKEGRRVDLDVTVSSAGIEDGDILVCCVSEDVLEEVIKVGITDGAGNLIWFRVKRSTPFKRVAQAYAYKSKLPLDNLRIASDYGRVDGDATVAFAGIQDGDILSASLTQVGD